jgi:exopolysaccharide biosynthesis polyprenyl glycosylphosphotransferase
VSGEAGEILVPPAGDSGRGSHEGNVAVSPDPAAPAQAASDGGLDTVRLRQSSHEWRIRYRASLFVADVVAALCAVGVCYLLRPRQDVHRVTVLGWRVEYGVLAAIAIPVWLLSLWASGAYRIHDQGDELSDYRIPVVTALKLMAAVAIGSFALKLQLSRLMVVAFFPTLIAYVFLLRNVARRGLTLMRRRGYALTRLLLVGTPHSVRDFADHLSRHGEHGFQIIGACVASEDPEVDTRKGPIEVVGSPDEVVEVSRELAAEAVAVVGHYRFSAFTIQRLAWQLERTHVGLMVAPDIVELAGPRIRIVPVSGLPLLHVSEPLIARGRQLKSIYERLLSLPLIAVASPVFLIAGLAILIDSGRPIFYRQERVGLGGKTFWMTKFRTMVQGAADQLDDLMIANEHDGVLFKIRRDPRVTRVGKMLRKFSLDELPQLFNVLRGDMVLIGPRPCLPSERELLSEAAHRRFLAKPGMTGLWQVSGRADVPWEEAALLDLYYVENWSPLMDLMILYRTIRIVFGGDNY